MLSGAKRSRNIPGNGHLVITQKHSNANQHKHLTNFAHEPMETALGGEPTETGFACVAGVVRWQSQQKLPTFRVYTPKYIKKVKNCNKFIKTT